MTRRLYNWTFENVASFLKCHGYSKIHVQGSHYYFKGVVNNKVCLVEVTRHTNKTIKPRTLKHSIMRKSGISAQHWMDCKKKHCKGVD